MAALLLRQGARRIVGSVLQRAQAAGTSPAVAEERRRLAPRRMYSTEKGTGDPWLDKWEDRMRRFRRFDDQFTELLKFGAGVYCIYIVLACSDNPPWPIRKYRAEWEKEGALTNKKQEE